MDELDRMYRRLVHNIRAGFPDLLTQPFEVASLYQHLIPYRLNRRELGIDSADEYELTITRLLSGTRGLLAGDPEMQAALRTELESANPDLSAFRAFGTARVALDPEALRTLEAAAMTRPEAGAPSHPDADRVVVHRAEMAGRATEEVRASGVPAAAPDPVHPQPPAPVMGSTPGHPRHGACRYCGGELPEGREIHFCPHCGQNLSLKQCPACSTELEVDWYFCITCGRQVE